MAPKRKNKSVHFEDSSSDSSDSVFEFQDEVNFNVKNMCKKMKRKSGSMDKEAFISMVSKFAIKSVLNALSGEGTSRTKVKGEGSSRREQTYRKVLYLDHLNFGKEELPCSSVPRILVWKGNTIINFSELDRAGDCHYGKSPLKSFRETCYYKSNSGNSFDEAEGTENSGDSNSLGGIFKDDLNNHVNYSLSPQVLNDISELYLKHSTSFGSNQEHSFKLAVLDVVKYFSDGLVNKTVLLNNDREHEHPDIHTQAARNGDDCAAAPGVTKENINYGVSSNQDASIDDTCKTSSDAINTRSQNVPTIGVGRLEEVLKLNRRKVLVHRNISTMLNHSDSEDNNVGDPVDDNEQHGEQHNDSFVPGADFGNIDVVENPATPNINFDISDKESNHQPHPLCTGQHISNDKFSCIGSDMPKMNVPSDARAGSTVNNHAETSDPGSGNDGMECLAIVPVFDFEPIDMIDSSGVFNDLRPDRSPSSSSDCVITEVYNANRNASGSSSARKSKHYYEVFASSSARKLKRNRDVYGPGSARKSKRSRKDPESARKSKHSPCRRFKN